jgi:hypothetical protein
MIILGIDPGIGRCGWGIIKYLNSSKAYALDFGCIETRPGEKVEERLLQIGEKVNDLINENKPDVLALPVAVGIDIETGGHVFQMFFTTSTFHTESYIMAYNFDPFWDKKPLFRIGFNVNRVFAL